MNPDEDFKLTEETLLKTRRFRVDRVRQEFADGQISEREVIQHPGAVVILPILPDGRVCLIRNYRVAVKQWLLELPAGTLEPGEPPIETAKRELIEETGFRAGSIKPLCQLLMSPGILHERMHAFVASDLTAGPTAQELGELISNVPVTIEQLEELLKSGKIEDAKTMAAVLFYLRFK